MHVADHESRYARGALSIVEQHDLLTRSISTGDDVPDLESHAETRARRLGHEDVAAGEPLEIAAEHRFFGQLRLAGLDVVVEQVRREHVVPVLAQPRADCAAGGNAAAIAANRAGEIDTHHRSLKSEVDFPSDLRLQT